MALETVLISLLRVTNFVENMKCITRCAAKTACQLFRIPVNHNLFRNIQFDTLTFNTAAFSKSFLPILYYFAFRIQESAAVIP
jgi:hypothetical protein